jgi:hypothetical protein
MKQTQGGSMSKKFPEVVYVAYDKQSDGVEYMLVDEAPTGHAVMERDVKVGVYKFVGFATVKNTSVLVK